MPSAEMTTSTTRPSKQGPNYGCPTFPHPSCGNTSDMFMNYMDCPDDACMNLFTQGQKTRMRAVLAPNGFRAGLTRSLGCSSLGGGCSGTQTLTAASGTFSDGSGSGNYQNNSDCRWLIQPPGATQIELTSPSFNTESGYDFVKAYDGATTSALLLGSYSGTALPPVLRSSGGSLLIVFASDSSITRAGWSASYTSNGTTSLPTEATPSEVRLYPVPCFDYLTIEVPISTPGEVLDATGRLVWQGMIPSGGYQLPVQTWPSGLYLLRIGSHSSARFVKE